MKIRTYVGTTAFAPNQSRPAGLAIAVVLLSATCAIAQGTNSANCNQQQHGSGCPTIGVYPPGSNPLGVSYGEWTARWWQWLTSIPGPVNPNLDTTGANCDQGQSGPVWFLAGRFSSGPQTVRACTVPADKLLLLPIANIWFGDGVGDCNGIGPLHPDPKLPTCPAMFAPVDFNQPNGWTPVTAAVVGTENNPPALELTVDGIPLRDPTAYRALAPQFSYKLPRNSLNGNPPGTYGPSGSDGYWVMLTPLPPGRHTIHFRTGDGFQDVLYNLRVENEH
jgi:hypothetical protein